MIDPIPELLDEIPPTSDNPSPSKGLKKATAPQTEHPESKCQECGADNPVWFAPNKLWNKVMPVKAAIVCPNCFIRIAELNGVHPTGWLLQTEPKNAPKDVSKLQMRCKPTIPQTERGKEMTDKQLWELALATVAWAIERKKFTWIQEFGENI